MPKNIIGSVGRGGRNHPASDVMTVQYLLNCVPVAQGGPARELAVDGLVGPKTVTAIEAFQRRLGGFADGRVDPGGQTLRALQARDPYPEQPLSATGAKGVGGPPVNKGGFGAPGNKDPFGNKLGSGVIVNGGPFGNGPGSGVIVNTDPFGHKGGHGGAAKDPFGHKSGFGAPANKGYGGPGAKDPFGGKGGAGGKGF